MTRKIMADDGIVSRSNAKKELIILHLFSPLLYISINSLTSFKSIPPIDINRKLRQGKKLILLRIIMTKFRIEMNILYSLILKILFRIKFISFYVNYFSVLIIVWKYASIDRTKVQRNKLKKSHVQILYDI
jgi:hypothetical protein